MRLCGIYMVSNTINGKRYIGSSVRIKRRVSDHFQWLRAGTHFNRHLQMSWNKYGEQAFSVTILLLCDPKMTLFYEQRALDTLKPEYNLALNARAPSLGISPSFETRAKLSAANKGKKLTKEHRRKLSLAIQGKTHNGEIRKRISEQTLGKKHGPMTAEHAKKIGDAKRGKPRDLATRLKLAKAQRGKRHTAETLEKMRLSQQKRRSEEMAS